MPGNLVPNQMYDHECNMLKGWWHPHVVDKSAEIADGETILAGSVCYLDSTGKFRSGLPDNTQGMFAWPSSTDFDVAADVGNTQKAVMTALPTLATYELFTTEFDATKTYAINDYLTAWHDQLLGFSVELRGKVRPGLPYHNTLVGQVSGLVKNNDFGKSVLTLWTYHLPVDLTNPSSEA